MSVLKYDLEQSKSEKIVVQQARLNNLPVPEKMKNKPILRPDLRFYWMAFLDLSSERTMGMSEGPIPWSRAVAYATWYGLSDEEIEDFWVLIGRMDEAYLRKRAEEQQSKNNMASKGGGQSSGSQKSKPTRRSKR